MPYPWLVLITRIDKNFSLVLMADQWPAPPTFTGGTGVRDVANYHLVQVMPSLALPCFQKTKIHLEVPLQSFETTEIHSRRTKQDCYRHLSWDSREHAAPGLRTFRIYIKTYIHGSFSQYQLHHDKRCHGHWSLPESQIHGKKVAVHISGSCSYPLIPWPDRKQLGGLTLRICTTKAAEN